MSQNLKLINKGDRYAPTTFQFGRNERLNIHQNNYADLTDATTGSCIRAMTWQDIRNMGYAPAKLLGGNETDQFLDNCYASALIASRSYIKHIAGGAVISLMIAVISNATGCTGLVLDKVNQDIATSTIAPRIAQTNANLARFKEQNANANKKLKKMHLHATDGSAQ